MDEGGVPAGVDRLRPAGASGVVGRCRDFVSASLDARGWLDDPRDTQRSVVEDVLLMTSELVTNACRHAGGAQELAVSEVHGRLRVEVADASPDHPEVRPLGAPALAGGHGLRVVQRLSQRWGSEPRTGGGKVVWFEVDHA